MFLRQATIQEMIIIDPFNFNLATHCLHKSNNYNIICITIPM
jgi:hypothetical protein